MWQRSLYYASYGLATTLAALRTSRPDIILADAPALWNGLPLLVQAISKHIPFIYVLHDIYPDIAIRLGLLKNSLFISLIERTERFFYRRAARLSVLSEGFRDNLTRKGVPTGKVTVIPACVDTDFVHPLCGDSKFREMWGLEGRFLVLYTANIGLPQGLENVLNAAQMLRDAPDIVFVFVGDGVARLALQAMATKMGLTNVRFYPLQLREAVPDVFGLADVSLVSLKKGITVEVVPSKMYNIMASGRPVLATVEPKTEIACLLERADCGLLVEPENAESLAQAVRQLHANPSLCARMGQNGRRYVVAYYSRQVAAQAYEALIRSIVR